MTNVMTSTMRERLLAHLRTRHRVTASELATALKVTPADARHHLARLLREGLVIVADQRREHGRGRPQKVFALAPSAAGENLGLLAESLLDAIPADLRAATLKQIAARLAGAPVSGSPLQRLNQTIDRLNARHYRARWEAGPSGPRIVLGNCPYAAIIHTQPALCQMDASLLETLLASSVEQTAKLEHNASGVPMCVFLVKNR